MSYNQKAAPVLYYLKKAFSGNNVNAKILLRFLLREKIYNPFIGRLTKYRDPYDSVPIEELDYNVYRKIGCSMANIFFGGFTWDENQNGDDDTPEAKNYMRHYNKMLPKDIEWYNINSRWMQECKKKNYIVL